MDEAGTAAAIVLGAMGAAGVVIVWILFCAHAFLDKSPVLYWVAGMGVPMMALWAFITVAMIYG